MARDNVWQANGWLLINGSVQYGRLCGGIENVIILFLVN